MRKSSFLSSSAIRFSSSEIFAKCAEESSSWSFNALRTKNLVASPYVEDGSVEEKTEGSTEDETV